MRQGEIGCEVGSDSERETSCIPMTSKHNLNIPIKTGDGNISNMAKQFWRFRFPEVLIDTEGNLKSVMGTLSHLLHHWT